MTIENTWNDDDHPDSHRVNACQVLDSTMRPLDRTAGTFSEQSPDKIGNQCAASNAINVRY